MSLFLRHPLVWIAVLIAATILTLSHFTDLQQQGTFDPLMLMLMVTSYTAAFVSVAVRTPWRSWTVLGAGLAATFLADALIWGYVFFTRVNADGEWGWTHGPSWLNAAHAAFIPHIAAALIVIRALFVVGGAFVLIGLIRDGIVEMRLRAESDRRDSESIARISHQLTAISREARSAARDAATEALASSDERTRIMLTDAAKQTTLLEVKTIVSPDRPDDHDGGVAT